MRSGPRTFSIISAPASRPQNSIGTHLAVTVLPQPILNFSADLLISYFDPIGKLSSKKYREGLFREGARGPMSVTAAGLSRECLLACFLELLFWAAT
jgi:hypothetical protein